MPVPNTLPNLANLFEARDRSIWYRPWRLSTAVFALWAVALPLMQVALWRVGHTDISLATPLALLIFACLIREARFRPTHLALFALLVTLLTAQGAFALSPREFFASYVQIVCLLGSVLITASVPLKQSFAGSIRIFFVASAALAVLVVAQAILWNVFHTYYLSSPLGPLSPLGPGYEIYEPNIASAVKRPNGIFSEPSVAAWYLSLAYAANLSLGALMPASRTRTALFAIAIVCTMTLSGVINVVIISIVALRFRMQRLWYLVAAATLGGLLLISSVPSTWVELFARRVHDLSVEGSSTYFRLAAPILLLRDSLYEFPFGHILGSTEFIESKSYMVNWAKGSSTNIDNSFFLVTYYFGIFGVLLASSVAGYLALTIARRKQSALIVLALSLALAETGALWSPHMALFLCYGLLLIRFTNNISTQCRHCSQ